MNSQRSEGYRESPANQTDGVHSIAEASPESMALRSPLSNDASLHRHATDGVKVQADADLKEPSIAEERERRDEEGNPSLHISQTNTPAPLLRERSPTIQIEQPQTATIISINRVVQPPDPAEEAQREERRRTNERRKQLLRRLFSQNMLYSKPNVAVFQSMLTLLLFVFFIFAVFVSNFDIPFQIMVVPYLFDLVTEAIVIYLYTSCDFMVVPSHWSIWIPYTTKALSVLVVGSDILFRWRGSAYLCFLPMLTMIGLAIQKSTYNQIKPSPVCLMCFLSICELMGMLYYGIELGPYYSTLFIILFYYFLVTFFFNMIGFLSAIMSLFIGMFNCFRQFKVKIFLVQFLLGADNILAIVFCLEFSNWLYYDAGYRQLSTAKMNGSLSKDGSDDYDRFSDLLTKSTFRMQVITGVVAFYTIIRNITIFWCTKQSLPQNQQIELRSGMVITMSQRVGTGNTAAAGSDNHNQLPRVEQPSTKDSILNLFRVNANYYTAANTGDTPAVKHPAQVEAAGQGVRPAENLNDGIEIKVGHRDADGDETCTICINEPSNCIILGCRHGGICKKCAFDMMKKSSLCPFCRCSIEKICVVLKMNDTQYKVIEEIKF